MAAETYTTSHTTPNGVTHIHVEGVNSDKALLVNLGRLTRRPDAPGWFVVAEGVGVLRDAEHQVRYFAEQADALTAITVATLWA